MCYHGLAESDFANGVVGITPTRESSQRAQNAKSIVTMCTTHVQRDAFGSVRFLRCSEFSESRNLSAFSG